MGNTFVYRPNAPAVKITGPIAHIDKVIEELTTDREGILQAVGDIAVNLMKKNTQPFDFDKTLTESIAWRTVQQNSFVPNTDHLIAPPNRNDQVDIGSHAPYAWFREYGAGRHTKADGSEEFVAAMRDWVQRRLGINTSPSATKEDKWEFFLILQHIRKGEAATAKQQGKEPFMTPVEARLPEIATKVSKDRMDNLWAKMAKRYRA
jgi:hypothetical protein